MVTNLRPGLARHLRRRLEAFGDGFRHNLALLGPAGSGKTFQLQELLADPPANVLLLYCPLYRESCRSFLQRFLCAVIQAGLAAPALESSEAPWTPADQSLEALLSRADAQLPNTASAIRSTELLVSRRQYGEAFTRALEGVRILATERQRPAVLILDEFLFLEDLGLGHAFHELGKRVMTWPSTLFILSSSAVHRARHILRERLQLLFGQFELLTLDAVEHETASAWLQQELRGVRGVNEMRPFLIQWLGASPWYLTVLARRLTELATLRRAPRLTESLFLQTVWDLLGRTEGPLHQWCASRIDGLVRSRSGARALEALLQIGQGARTSTEIARRVGRADLPNALQVLVEHDLAQRNGMCWMVVDPILRCWLSTVFSSQRAGLPREEPEIQERFERYLRQLWLQWTQAHELSFADQVVALFERFHDEIVSVDCKTGRLPHFDTIQTQRPTIPGVEAFLVADGKGRRWCAAVHAGPVEESAIASFEAFCRSQTPKPSRKVVIMKADMDQNARLFAKAANMWVWGLDDLRALRELYGQA